MAEIALNMPTDAEQFIPIFIMDLLSCMCAFTRQRRGGNAIDEKRRVFFVCPTKHAAWDEMIGGKENVGEST
jgi:hypothetical protein